MSVDFSNTKQQNHDQLYLCQQCGVTFRLADAKLACPICSAAGHDNIIPVYVENDPEKEQMYSPVDWQAGD